MTDNSLKKSSIYLIKYDGDWIMGAMSLKIYNEEEGFDEPSLKFDYPVYVGTADKMIPDRLMKYPVHGINNSIFLKKNYISVMTEPDAKLFESYIKFIKSNFNLVLVNEEDEK